MQKMKHIINALPLVADALGRKYGINVRIGGNRAYTDGNNIQLPALPLDADETALNLARGYLDHEAAHLRHTDFDILAKASLSPIEKHVWNIIEDFMVERKLASIYPGCVHNFAWLIRHVFLDSEHATQKSVAELVFDWILIALRSLSVPELLSEKMRLETLIAEDYPALLQELSLLAKAIPHICVDTGSCIEMARKIVQCLQNYVYQQEKSQSSDSQASSRERANKTQVRISAANAGSQSSHEKEQNRTTEEDGDASDGTNCQHDEIGKDETPNKSSGGNEPVKTKGVTLQAIFQDDLLLQSGDLGEITGKMLEAIGQSGSGDRLEIAIVRQNQNMPLPASEISEIRQTTSALRHRLSALLQSKVLCRNHLTRTGRLDHRRLARLSIADSRIFARPSERQGVNTAIHILLDASGSMGRNGKLKLACQSCYAVAEALYKIPGVSVAVSSFPAGTEYNHKLGESSWSTVCPILCHKQKFHDRFMVKANGGTPMAQALWWALRQMAPLSEKRKILLIVSDGEPDNMEETKNAIQQHRVIGHEVYGIGITSAAIKRLLESGACRTIFDLRELPETMFEMLRPALLGISGGIHENAS